MYNLSAVDSLKKLKTNKDGLSTKEARIRLQEYGQNKLPQSKQHVTKLKIFLEQWKSPLILILAVAGIISGVLGEYIDMSVIFITVGVNVIIGFVQEFKADQALKKLSNMVEYKALILRNGKEMLVKSSQIVPGDIMVLDAGTKIQADGRIVESTSLEINESVLTGESEPIKKHTKSLKGKLALGDRKNMVYKGTVVVNGRAHVLVTDTGEKTEIGQIASLVKTTKQDKTPLQTQLSRMGKIIGVFVVFISIGIFLLGIFSKSEHHGLLEMFETSVAVAVAAIPEGLVISMTVILAIGMQHILKKKALVRKLLAAETLGSVSVICTDKTGTLTEGKMQVTHVVTAQDEVSFGELAQVHTNTADSHNDIITALRIGVMCNDGVIENPQDSEKKWKFFGDTTDTALVYAGMKAGLEKHHLDSTLKRIAEVPFDSENKFMATLHKDVDNEELLYVKGAAEVLYKRCSYYEENGEVKKMTKKMSEWFAKQEEILTSKGLRVLAVAYKKYEKNTKKLDASNIKDLVLVGLVALSDPLRSDVKDTIENARGAGIRIVMITGDHVRTAQSIARELNIPAEDENIFNGQQLEDITDEDLRDAIGKVSVFARVDPKHKIRIVEAFQAKGEVVAMTGDGVNDAPALKGADIGVALGSGTDVAKEISDMVLMDDHFNTIVDAVEEGRGIYQNIKKVVLYLVSGSFSEVLMITGSLIAGLPLPVLPAQILWVNLIEDSFPNMALAFDKGDKENMQDKPRRRNEPIIDKEMKTMIVAKVILANIALFAIFLYFYKTTGNLALTRTVIFVGFAIDSLFYIFSIRSLRHMVYKIPLFDNKYLIGAVALGWVLLIMAIYLPPFQLLLRTVPLGLFEWSVMIGFGLFNLVLIEIIKAVFLIKDHKSITQ
ncbi:ATPase [Candidatus Parcubacteria bacterium]|nr:MAG: ATPase [Candidatus Parcubacteria bacterium]